MQQRSNSLGSPTSSKSDGLLIRTLECSKCRMFDSAFISQKDLAALLEDKDLEIGSVIINHEDHDRIVYFLVDGSYLGDSIVEFEETENEFRPDSKPSRGSFFSRIRKSLFSILFGKQLIISITGSSQAGKTTLARYLATGKPLRLQDGTSLPTLGKSMREIRIGRSTVTLLDLGGQQDFWNLWQEAVSSSSFFIHLVDGSRTKDEEQIEALRHIAALTKSSNLNGIILVNKLDLYLTKECSEFLRRQDIESIAQQFGLHFPVLEVSLLEGIAYVGYGKNIEERNLADHLKSVLKKL